MAGQLGNPQLGQLVVDGNRGLFGENVIVFTIIFGTAQVRTRGLLDGPSMGLLLGNVSVCKWMRGFNSLTIGS